VSTHLYVCARLLLSLFLSICNLVSSYVCLSVHLFFHLPIFIHRTGHLSLLVRLPICLRVCLSIDLYQSTCLSLCTSIYQSDCPPVCLTDSTLFVSFYPVKLLQTTVAPVCLRFIFFRLLNGHIVKLIFCTICTL